MQKLRKLGVFMALLTALFVGTQTIPQRDANAVVLVSIVAGGHIHHSMGVGGIILCVVFLPLCVLDENGTVSEVTPQDLRDNGYGDQEIADIYRDQVAVTGTLKLIGKKLVVEKTDSLDDVRQALRDIQPGVSENYVRFVADSYGVQ